MEGGEEQLQSQLKNIRYKTINVLLSFRSSDMVATITTNKIFTGKIYAKENPNSCVVDVQVSGHME